MKAKKRKPKKRKVSLAAILRRKDVKEQLRAKENAGYHRGFAACKNNPDMPGRDNY